jgi:NAD(P)H-hydrate epimerase
MAAQGALISGCGKVITYTPENAREVIRNNIPQIIAYGSEKKNLSDNDLPVMKELLKGVDVLVIGPGIGRDKNTKNFVLGLLEMVSNLDLSKVLIDADGLLAIKDDMKLLKNIDDTIITPHPGELSKLTGKGINELINNIEMVREYAGKWKTTLLLKGSTSIISDRGKNVRLNITGNTGLAKGGSGDLLSGTIGAFMAQNMNGYDAASLGSYIMGKAAEMANVNQRSCTIHDVTGAYSKVFDLLKKINRC